MFEVELMKRRNKIGSRIDLPPGQQQVGMHTADDCLFILIIFC